jgi:hypothetical protein
MHSDTHLVVEIVVVDVVLVNDEPQEKSRAVNMHGLQLSCLEIVGSIVAERNMA